MSGSGRPCLAGQAVHEIGAGTLVTEKIYPDDKDVTAEDRG